MSTMVTYGRGKGLVTGTGMHTQIGLIAEMIQSYEDEDTPLQQKLEHLGKVLGTICIAICAFVFIYGLVRDTKLTDIFTIGFLNYLQGEQKDIINLFMTAVSLAIAAVPEGLPAIVTICLALGMQQMVKRHALDPQTARGGNAGLRHGDLLRQDRHADAERDDGRAGMGRRQALPGHGRGLQPERTVFRGRQALRSAHRRGRGRAPARGAASATTPSWRREATKRASARGRSSAIPPKVPWSS